MGGHTEVNFFKVAKFAPFSRYRAETLQVG